VQQPLPTRFDFEIFLEKDAQHWFGSALDLDGSFNSHAER
jgi:hypothetical protein